MSVGKPEASCKSEEAEGIGTVLGSEDKPNEESILKLQSQRDSGMVKCGTLSKVRPDTMGEGDRLYGQLRALDPKQQKFGSRMFRPSKISDNCYESVTLDKAILDSKSERDISPRLRSCTQRQGSSSTFFEPGFSSDKEMYKLGTESSTAINLQQNLLNEVEGNRWTPDPRHIRSKYDAIIEGSMNKPYQSSYRRYEKNNPEIQMNWSQRNVALDNKANERIPSAFSKPVVGTDDHLTQADINEIQGVSVAKMAEVFNELYIEDEQGRPGALSMLDINYGDYIGAADINKVLNDAAAKLNEIVSVAVAKINAIVDFEDSCIESSCTDEFVPWSDPIRGNERSRDKIDQLLMGSEEYAAAADMDEIMNIGAINLNDAANIKRFTINEVETSAVDSAAVSMHSSSDQEGDKSETRDFSKNDKKPEPMDFGSD